MLHFLLPLLVLLHTRNAVGQEPQEPDMENIAWSRVGPHFEVVEISLPAGMQQNSSPQRDFLPQTVEAVLGKRAWGQSAPCPDKTESVVRNVTISLYHSLPACKRAQHSPAPLLCSCPLHTGPAPACLPPIQGTPPMPGHPTLSSAATCWPRSSSPALRPVQQAAALWQTAPASTSVTRCPINTSAELPLLGLQATLQAVGPPSHALPKQGPPVSMPA